MEICLLEKKTGNFKQNRYKRGNFMEKPIQQSCSIVVFFYNEAGNIEKVLRQAVAFLKPLPNNKKEIIFIDDGSKDNTVEKIKSAGYDESYIKIIRHPKNLGIGACLKTGYKTARMENISAVPGDGQFDLNELRAFRHIPANTVVSFYRTSHPGYSLFRKALTKANRYINKIFFCFDVKDVNWVKIYKKEGLKNLKLMSKSNFVESEIMCFLSKNCKIIQSPSRFLPRASGSSKSVNIKILCVVFADILRLLFRRIFRK